MGMQTIICNEWVIKEGYSQVYGDTGEVNVNGKVNMPFNKLVPRMNCGSPQIERLWVMMVLNLMIMTRLNSLRINYIKFQRFL